MQEVPEDRLYAREHEWAMERDGSVTVGITMFAQDQLGDVVFIRLPEVGEEVEAGKQMGELESTKTVSDLYSPVSGTVLERNSEVEDSPELINQDPYGRGWLVKIDMYDPAHLQSLLGPGDYQDLLSSER